MKMSFYVDGLILKMSGGFSFTAWFAATSAAMTEEGALAESERYAAEAAMQARMAAGPRAVSARFDARRARVVVRLDSGLELAFPPKLAEGLDQGSPADLAVIEISPSGLGLHWPNLDADLYLPALMEGVFGSPRWMAALMGAKGGSARTAAKAEASRTNGRLGGRPRKSG